MADENQRRFDLRERAFQQFDRRQIEVVRRFVHDDHPGLFQQPERETDLAHFAGAGNLGFAQPRRNRAEAADERHHLAELFRWQCQHFPDDFARALDRDFLRNIEHPVRRKINTGNEQPQKRALARAVRADDADAVTGQNRHFGHFEKPLGDSIGKRYRRQDAIGTPFCVTVDHDSLNDNCVTIRERDTMEQKRVPIAELRTIIDKEVNMNNLLRKL